MSTRKEQFINGEYYHIFNRGNNKRIIFADDQDFARFFQSMVEFNSIEPIGSIFENSFKKDLLGGLASKSSWDEYVLGMGCFCEKNIILSQFKDSEEYKKFAEDSIKLSKERKDLEKLFLE